MRDNKSDKMKFLDEDEEEVVSSGIDGGMAGDDGRADAKEVKKKIKVDPDLFLTLVENYPIVSSIASFDVLVLCVFCV